MRNFKLSGIKSGLILLILGLAAFGITCVFKNNFFPQPAFLTLEKMKAKSLADIEARLPEVINRHGVPAALSWVREGFAAETINMFQCHTLTHMIGHRAFSYYGEDVEKALIGMQLDECEGGYVHGVEAQAVDSGANYRPLLFKICTLIQNAEFAYGGCYHGAGHAFMQPSRTIQTALDLCSALAGGPTDSFDSCYNGVFSEYTNLLGGMDGHTGLPLSQGPPFKLEGTAIKFCSTFEEKYQVPCALEVSGFRFGPGKSLEDIEDSMRECVEPIYQERLQVACLQSMAAVTAQHELPFRSVKPPKFIYTLPLALRRAYITGTASETKAFIHNGQKKDWQSFCSSFFDDHDRSFCDDFFQN